nr:class A beta-lactamase [uncultured bacterium]
MKTTLLCLMSLALALAAPLPASAGALTETVRQMETENGSRIGLALAQSGAAPVETHRAGERFPMASTFKVLACAAVLARVDRGDEDLGRTVAYAAADLVTYSPVTEKHVATGMTVGALCEAAITLSDNTAANLLLARIGGPAGLTAFLRDSGDAVTRLDRTETTLNEATPGDPRDTTTPEAMLATLDRLLFGSVLSPASRRQLEAWMQADKVADGLIRASLPAGWQIGDKTGAGGHGTRGIVAVIRPPAGKPWLAVISMTGRDQPLKARDAVIARIGRGVIDSIADRAGN